MINITDAKHEESKTDELQAGLKSYSPWVLYVKKMEALFKNDECVDVLYNEDNGHKPEVKLVVTGETKAKALRKLLPEKVQFGNIDLTVTVVENKLDDVEVSGVQLFTQAFEGNKALDRVMNGTNPMTANMTFAIFHKEVVQYDADNLGNPTGQVSTLYEDLAAELFGGIDGLFFCTNSEVI